MTGQVCPSATVLLLRDAAHGPEVLMLVRPPYVSAFPDAVVFPGGKVEPDDHHRDFVTHGATAVAPVERPYAVAAVREAFEECGLLLARTTEADRLISGCQQAALVPWRDRLMLGTAPLSALCRYVRLQLALDLLVPFGHWITPRGRPRIFDTRFFLAPAPDDQQVCHDGIETLQALWLTPREAIARAECGELQVLFPTRMNLARLARASSVSDALARASGEPVVTVQPEIEPHPDGQVMVIPPDAGYGASRVLVPEIGGRYRILR